MLHLKSKVKIKKSKSLSDFSNIARNLVRAAQQGV